MIESCGVSKAQCTRRRLTSPDRDRFVLELVRLAVGRAPLGMRQVIV